MTELRANDRVLTRLTGTVETRIVQALIFSGVWVGIMVAACAIAANAINEALGVN